MATMLDESSPALRNAPIGTSLTICASTERRKRSRISSAKISFRTRVRCDRRAGNVRSQYCVSLQFAIAENRVVTRGQLENSAKHRLGIGHPKKRQVLMERLRIEFCFDPRHLQQRLDLGGKGERFALVTIVERLHSEVIASNEQTLALPERRSQIANANMPFSRLTQSGPSCS